MAALLLFQDIKDFYNKRTNIVHSLLLETCVTSILVLFFDPNLYFMSCMNLLFLLRESKTLRIVSYSRSLSSSSFVALDFQCTIIYSGQTNRIYTTRDKHALLSYSDFTVISLLYHKTHRIHFLFPFSFDNDL